MPGNTYRLESIERASMTEQVLRELRDAIVEGRIAQGEPLREVSRWVERVGDEWADRLTRLERAVER